MSMILICPCDCGKRTFCHKGEPLPYDKSICYSTAINCIHCHLPKWYMKDGHGKLIPHPKSTEQYWKGKVCICQT
jgi:hypothetical protein